MGLDMYLFGRKPDGTLVEIAYWRKAHAIHGWFVRNVQNGNDDCESYEVKKEKIEELLEICIQVAREAVLTTRVEMIYELMDGTNAINFMNTLIVENPGACQTVLPIDENDFSNTKLYNENYMKVNIYDTIAQLEGALEDDYILYMYTSSW